MLMDNLNFLKNIRLYLFALFFFSLNNLFSQSILADGSSSSSQASEENVLANNKIMNTVVCPVLAGITCTISGPSSSTYLGAPAGCNAGSFAGSNPWDGGSSAGYVRWQFSSPIKAVTLKAGSVNTNDYATHTFSGGTGGTITISSLVCLSSLVGMTIGVFTSSCCGDVAWTLTSTGTFTQVNLANTGGASGWIAECPSFITVLPIELIAFDGVCKENKTIDLKWKTISEIDNDYFTIERSIDAEKWTEISRVKGAGNSNQIIEYSFTDNVPFKGLNYYRLKQIDKSGDYEYSPLAVVENCNDETEVSFYPNPAESFIMINNFSSQKTVVEVYDAMGIIVATLDCEIGENEISTSQFKNGIYFFKAANTGKNQRVIIQH